ncbi:MAG TPA: alpha/beta hydrolase [Streptosporangiaceae bacterium]|nr:alpha/beta hydrolase [Streptosporangiaceae bacterium]
MPRFHAADGTELAYHVRGTGAALVCVPGGPMRASAYLGDLGGLSARRQLIMLDLRGTGSSAAPADPASYRCDRLVDDVAALRDHLGLDRFDLLAHSAGANIAVQFAIRHPGQLSRLALITPSGRAAGLEPGSELRRQVVLRRQGEPWFAAASAAFGRITDGTGTEADWMALSPLFYGRWDDAARAHDAAGETQTNEEAAEAFGAAGAFDPAAARAALATLAVPVLVLGGELDLQRPPKITAEFARLFPAARLVIQDGAGHYPWLDDPGQFGAAVTAFLDDSR